MKKHQEVTDAGFAEERELLRRVKQGDHQAFTDVVSRYQKAVFKLALGFFQDKDDAMEIVQETFLRVYQKIDRFDEGSNFKNWVLRISYNLCVDYYRKFKNKKTYDRDVFEFNETIMNGEKEPEQHVDDLNFKENLRESLQTLSKRQKIIVVLKHYNSLKYHEIADMLNISVGTVKSLHHRATRSLKKKLARYEVAN